MCSNTDCCEAPLGQGWVPLGSMLVTWFLLLRRLHFLSGWNHTVATVRNELLWKRARCATECLVCAVLWCNSAEVFLVICFTRELMTLEVCPAWQEITFWAGSWTNAALGVLGEIFIKSKISKLFRAFFFLSWSKGFAFFITLDIQSQHWGLNSSFQTSGAFSEVLHLLLSK